MIYGERGDYFVGEWPHHMYVEYQRPGPGVIPHTTPVVMYHGGMGTGAAYWSTPDGRPGWAPYFVQHGWTVYVVDWPGHGRSGFPPDYPTMPYERVVDAAIALGERLGPAVLLGGSMAGPVMWKVADHRPDLVKAILAWAPGPPANLQDIDQVPPGLPTAKWADETQPVRYGTSGPGSRGSREDFRKRFSAGPKFPREAFEQNFLKEVPESARIMNQRYNKDGTGLRVENVDRVREVPILVVSGDQDPGHPKSHDQEIAEFLHGDYLYLADAGLPGHSHQMRFDRGNLEIADLLLAWLSKTGVS
jgi:pimeloyl-ACP methyl ester carboxylesterase